MNDSVIRSSGAPGVIRPGKNSVQVIIGTSVQFVADELKKQCGSQAATLKQTAPGKHRMVTPQDRIFDAPESPVDDDHFTCTLTDQTGIHARPAGEIASIAKQYECEVTVEANGKSCSAKSVAGLMSLGAAEGTQMTFRATGPEGSLALSALWEYMEEKL